MSDAHSIPIFANARALPAYSATREICRRLVTLLAGSTGLQRAELHAGVRPLLDRHAIDLSSDTAKAIDSMIDIQLATIRFGILDVADGISAELLSDFFALLYLKNSPDIRIESIDISHVPMVVQGNLETYQWLQKMQSRNATVSELKMVFLQALIHDSGKWNPNIRTVTGFTFAKESPLNNFTQEIRVEPGESLMEAMEKLELAPSLLPKFAALLTPILVHPDAFSVKRFVDELAGMGIVTLEESRHIWKAINAQGFVSSWTIRNALGDSRIRSNIYNPEISPEYQKYLSWYRPLTERLKRGMTPEELTDKTRYPEDAAMVARLREEVATLPDNEVAMLIGDHQGQNDIVKYMDIQTLKPATHALSVHQLIFGRTRPVDSEPVFIRNWMENSITGVLVTHTYEQRLIDAVLGEKARRGFEASLSWLKAPADEPGLARAILDDDSIRGAFEHWKETTPGAGDVLDWLDHVPIIQSSKKSEMYTAIRKRIETCFYNYYAPDPATGAPSKFTLTDT